MIRTVSCSSCATTFPVDPRKVPDEGVYARCSACSAVFFVEGGAAVPAASTGHSSQTFESTAAAFGGGAATAAPPAPPATGPALVDKTDDWVFEREPDIDTSAVAIEPLGTVEDAMRRETPTFAAPGAAPIVDEPPPYAVREPEPIQAAPAPPPPPPPPPPAPEPIRAAPPPPPSPPPPAPTAPSMPTSAPAAAKPTGAPTKSFSFGKRDPHEKASRLARVLVSDIITYNPERHQRALDGGTLKQDFEDEIKKSWGEYVDQVGKELAETTEYFNKALNEILARGQQIF
jgi:predicted Zn finger-like uncharacterized protein